MFVFLVLIFMICLSWLSFGNISWQNSCVTEACFKMNLIQPCCFQKKTNLLCNQEPKTKGSKVFRYVRARNAAQKDVPHIHKVQQKTK